MGKGVAKVLASIDDQEHEIIILGRSKKAGEGTIKEIEEETNNRKVSFILCDLAKLGDVKKAISEIQAKYAFLDGIFINAGLGYAAGRVETADAMDSHFQVNYLSQFMLTLNLLHLLEKSEKTGRVIFNVTTVKDDLFWQDLQLRNDWGYEKGIHQAMVAKRIFLNKLHNLYRERRDSGLSFVGFEISKTVWTNQINIIPFFMRAMANLMKWFGQFISIEECGEIISPLFTEEQATSLQRSGRTFTWKKNAFIEIKEKENVLDHPLQDKLWQISLDLCADEKTNQIAKSVSVSE